MQRMERPGPAKNVGQTERMASILGGAALLIFALLRRAKLSLPLLLGGGYLLYRGASGNCLIYQAIGLQRSQMEDGDTGVYVERSITIGRPVEEVYDYWRNFSNLPHFMQHLATVETGADGQSHWTAKAPLGRTVEWDAEIDEERENELITWHSLPGSQIENTGRVQFEEAPGARGTVVHLWLSYRPPAGSAGTAVARLFGEEPDIQVREDLRRFKRILETGEAPTVYGQSSGRREEVQHQRNQGGAGQFFGPQRIDPEAEQPEVMEVRK